MQDSAMPTFLIPEAHSSLWQNEAVAYCFSMFIGFSGAFRGKRV
jgi:hypothetical protein